jgi:hypothetical protein
MRPRRRPAIGSAPERTFQGWPRRTSVITGQTPAFDKSFTWSAFGQIAERLVRGAEPMTAFDP